MLRREMNGPPGTQLTARKRTRQNTTGPRPSAGLAQQALEANALRVRQDSQLIFLAARSCHEMRELAIGGHNYATADPILAHGCG